MAATPVPLDLTTARRLALRAQGLLGRPYGVSPATSSRLPAARRVEAVRDLLEHLGAVQLDTISVLARSHELVAFSRLGAVGRDTVTEAYWGGTPATSFEYWSHAACLLPVSEWPWFAFRRRHFRRRGVRWHEVPTAALDQVRARLHDEGPLTASGLGGAKRGGVWWDWSDTKIAVEWLLDLGEVVCTRREGWRRVYDLPARALPPEVLGRRGSGATTWSRAAGVAGPTDDECLSRLLAVSARALGVGTLGDLLDVHRLTGHATPARFRELAAALVADGVLVPARVEGWKAPAFVDPDALADLEDAGRVRHRTTLLSPFDSLVWHRPRTARLFGVEHRLEAYVPAEKRVHGYYAMPVLHAGAIVGRVDPKREGSVLRARRVSLEVGRSGRVSAAALDGTARALREAAAWVGCDEVVVDAVTPVEASASLATALNRR